MPVHSTHATAKVVDAGPLLREDAVHAPVSRVTTGAEATAAPAERRPFFLITIDTEGDNLWTRPQEITTRNAEYLGRFQSLCDRYGLRPTYLTNYEMALSPVFEELGRDLVRRGAGEIGMHLHGWNSPPDRPLTPDDHACHPYLIEYPLEDMRAKIRYLTDLLQETFEVPMRSHRAGRWAMDERYARLLIEAGYRVDCSVTPGVSWTRSAGAPHGTGGRDYTGFPNGWYFVDPDDLCSPGSSSLLEVPPTIVPDMRLTTRVARRLARRLPYAAVLARARRVQWLRPNGRNRQLLLDVLDDRAVAEAGYAEFMLHSSEFMPGGSPTFPTARSIEALYEDLEALFTKVAARFRAATLSEFHSVVVNAARPTEQHAS